MLLGAFARVWRRLRLPARGARLADVARAGRALCALEREQACARVRATGGDLFDACDDGACFSAALAHAVLSAGGLGLGGAELVVLDHANASLPSADPDDAAADAARADAAGAPPLKLVHAEWPLGAMLVEINALDGGAAAAPVVASSSARAGAAAGGDALRLAVIALLGVLALARWRSGSSRAAVRPGSS